MASLTLLPVQAPLITGQREEYERCRAEKDFLTRELAQALDQRDEHIRRANEQFQLSGKTKEANELLERQLVDLGRQVQTLLREISIRDDPSLSSIDIDEPTNDLDINESAANSTITSELVLFKNLAQLQSQNQKLLLVARNLAAACEEKERARDSVQEHGDFAIDDAQRLIEDMRVELDRWKSVADKAQDESRMLREMIKGRQDFDHRTAFSSAPVHTERGEDYRTLWEQQKDLSDEAHATIMTLKDELASARREVGQQTATLAKAQAQVEFYGGETHSAMI